LQNEAPIPTDAKVQLIDALSGTGVQRIEAVSFVHPRAIPQMADADEVWARITRNPRVRYSALIPNSRGAERAIRAGFREIEVVVSASDTHNRRNLNRSTADSLDDITALIPPVHDAGVTLEVIVATSFGCPFEGDIDPDRVAGIVARVRADGADRIAFGDTTGMATPRRVRDLLSAVRPDLLHFHNTRGTGLANILTALEPRGDRVRRERRRDRRLPVRAGRLRQRGDRGGRPHAARHGHRHRNRPGPPDRNRRDGRKTLGRTLPSGVLRAGPATRVV
jgi:hydroxymethylglutaryl-CoA lyase